MCCLRFEHDTYAYEIKKTPPVDSTVKTPDGTGVVTEISPLAGTVKVHVNDSFKIYHRDEVKILSMPKKKNDNNDEDVE